MSGTRAGHVKVKLGALPGDDHSLQKHNITTLRERLTINKHYSLRCWPGLAIHSRCRERVLQAIGLELAIVHVNASQYMSGSYATGQERR